MTTETKPNTPDDTPEFLGEGGYYVSFDEEFSSNKEYPSIEAAIAEAERRCLQSNRKVKVYREVANVEILRTTKLTERMAPVARNIVIRLTLLVFIAFLISQYQMP